jgi:hypothetical protein
MTRIYDENSELIEADCPEAQARSATVWDCPDCDHRNEEDLMKKNEVIECGGCLREFLIRCGWQG